MRAEQFSDLEQEAIVLFAVWDMLTGMVNYAFFEKFEERAGVTLMFPDGERPQAIQHLSCRLPFAAKRAR
jgi:hypothetical protein